LKNGVQGIYSWFNELDSIFGLTMNYPAASSGEYYPKGFNNESLPVIISDDLDSVGDNGMPHPLCRKGRKAGNNEEITSPWC